jgi:hypothetical protein
MLNGWEDRSVATAALKLATAWCWAQIFTVTGASRAGSDVEYRSAPFKNRANTILQAAPGFVQRILIKKVEELKSATVMKECKNRSGAVVAQAAECCCCCYCGRRPKWRKAS